MPTCELCNREFGIINSNHTMGSHGITFLEYCKEYGNPNVAGGAGAKIKGKKTKSSTKKELSAPNVRTLEDIYELDETIVVPKKFTMVTQENSHLLTDIKQLTYQYGIIDVDTETTGLDPFSDRITDLIITIGDEPTYSHNYFIPLAHVDKEEKHIDFQLDLREVKEWCKPFLEDKRIKKGFFTGYYDCMMFSEDWEIFVENIYWDGHPGSHVLQENENKRKLKNLYARYLFEHETDPEIKALNVETYEEQFGKIKFYRIPLKVATCYGAKDGYMTRRLREFQKPYIDTIGNLKNIFYNIEMPLLPVLLDMRREGIPIDLKRAEELTEILQEEVKQTEINIRNKVGDINLNSPQQLKKALFEDLKLPNIGKGSTKKEVLNDLADMGYDIAKWLTEYRRKQKLITTYTDSAESYISPRTGKAHTKFNQAGTVTGRFSSNDPNLQNIPARADKRIRTMFRERPGWSLISKDYSQIEPRILTHLTQDPALIAVYREGRDVYAEMGSRIYSQIEERDISIDEAGTDKYRTPTKTIFLGIMYGMTNIGLSKKLAIHKNEAQEIIDAFYSGFPVIAKYVKDKEKFCKREGYVETIYGRKRRLDNIYSDEWWLREKTKRQILNSEIQGTAADIIKKAMIAIGTDHEIKSLGGMMTLTVHDEILSKAPYETTIDVTKLMILKMKSIWDLSVPIDVDAELYYDRRWYGRSVILKHVGESEWELTHNKEVIDEAEYLRLCKQNWD
jgi:DNA polymerase I